MPEDDSESVDTSPDLDLVTFFSSSAHDAEMEAMNIYGMLQASGISAVLVGASTIPSLEFQVQVPRGEMEEATRIMREAQEAGPQAADEAEQASEGPV